MMCTAAADFDGVMRYMGEAVSLGRELDVKEQLAMGLTHIANTQTFMTHFDEAWHTAQEALQISRAIGDRMREAELLAMPIASYHLRSGDLPEARRAAAHGRNIAAQIGHAFPQILGDWMLGEVARLRGEYDEALMYHERSLQAAKPAEAFMPFLMVQPMASLGAVYLEISDAYAGRAAELHTYALKLLDTPAGLGGGGTAWADVGYCALALGNIAVASEVFQKGLTMPTMYKLIMRPRHLMGAALVALEQDRVEEAAPLALEARAYVEERAMKYLYPQVAMLEAQVASKRGDHQSALEHYARAEQLALTMTMRPIVWQACAGAAQSLAHLGRVDESDLKRREAIRTIDEIAALFTAETLRAQFMQSALRKVGQMARSYFAAGTVSSASST
jgi:tetratricopeptide (TPR) repeat protein